MICNCNLLIVYTGVDRVEASVETGDVNVHYNAPATPEDFLSALQKWSTKSGKSVAAV